MQPATTPGPVLDLRLFGQGEVSVCGTSVTAVLPKRALWLLAILALKEGKPVERQSLAGMLWPDKTDEAALHNLRQLLSPLRRALGDAKHFIQPISPRSLFLNLSRDIRVDVFEFDRACAEEGPASLERAVELYTDPFLAGCDEPFARTPRESRAGAFLRAADRLAKHFSSESRHREAADLLRRILIEDPYRESACRSLMQALVELGEAPAALEICRSFRRRLREDLNTDLDPETKALSKSIRTSSAPITADQPHRTTARQRIPAPLTLLVGRESEIASVSSIVSRCRLVTLTGAGGVGKTRLAIAVADRLANQYLDGAWFVDLAPVHNGDAIPTTIAGTLDIQEEANRPIIETIAARLREREMLVVLDNCEHVSEAVAGALESLLTSAPGLHVLATSRQSIGVSGEFVWPVPSLSIPALERHAAAVNERERTKAILESDAVRLLLDRCRVNPKDYVSKPAELERIASICRRLDGLPLAIELAAARFTILTFAEIDSRLQSRLDLLKGGSRDLPRHQTLQASIEWSWDLLTEPERRLLTLLSVFRGGSTLEAIEAVAAGEENILDLLTSLVDRSLVVAGGDGEERRFLLLETIRQFSHEKLEECGELEAAFDRHRDFFLDWAEYGGSKLATPEETPWFEKFETEHDNLRSAIAWCYSRGKAALALRFCSSLGRFWDTHGHLSEGRRQMETALSHPTPGLDGSIRPRAHLIVGWMATVQKDTERAIWHYEEALPYFREIEDERSVAKTLTCLGSAYMLAENFAAAKASWDEAIEICKATDNYSGLAMNLSNLAEMALEQGDTSAARLYVEGSLEASRVKPNISPQTGGQILCALSLTNLREGRIAEARANALEALRLFHDAKLVVHVPIAIEHVAVVDGALKNWDVALRLLSACASLSVPLESPLTPLLDRDRSETLSAARKALGPARFEAIRRAGMSMTLDDALSCALA